MPPRRKAAGEAEAKVKNIASKEAASRAEMAAAEALKAAQNPAALAPPPPPAPSQPATKPNLLEQVKQKNRAAPAKAQNKTPQNRTITGRVQKSKKESPAGAGQSASQQGPQKNIPQAPQPPSVNKPQLARRPSTPQQNLQNEPSHSPRPVSNSGPQFTRRPSTSQECPQSHTVQTPRTPQANGHYGVNHPTLSSPGKPTNFYNPLSQQNGMETSPVSPSMGSALRRSSSSKSDQAERQWTTLPPQFSISQPPQMRQLPQAGQPPNPAQFYGRQSFGAASHDGSGQGQLQHGMQSPHNRRFSMSFPQSGHGMQAAQGQSPHSDQVLRRQSLGADSKDGFMQGQMKQMMASQSSHMRRYSQNGYGIQAGFIQLRSPSFQSVQSGQGQQSQGFQGQQGYHRPNQQQGMQPQQMATLSYQSLIQQIQNRNHQSQYQSSTSNNVLGQRSQSRHSPTMALPNASNQSNPVPGGPAKLQVKTAVKLLDLQGKEDESSASTQASPERPYDKLNSHSPLRAGPSHNPQAKLVNRRESVSLQSARPTLNRTPSSLSRSITALENNEDSEMGGIVEDGTTEAVATSVSQVSKSVKSSPGGGPIISEANPSGRKQAPKKFTNNDSIAAGNKSFKGGRHQGSSPEPETNPSPFATTMRGTVPPTPKKWTNLPPPFFQRSSSPASLPPRSGVNQTEPLINEIDNLLLSALSKNNKNGIDPESELGPEEDPPSSPTPRSATNNGEFDILIQDPIGALLVSRAQVLAAEASQKKSTGLELLEQRHKDGLAGFTDFGQEDIRRTGVAARLLASISGPVNKSAPRPSNAQARCPVPVDFKDLAIGHLKRTKDYPGNQFNMCSFCNHEEDWGIGLGDFLLPRAAFKAYCIDCNLSQNHFGNACFNTEPHVESIMTVEKQIELNHQVWRNPALKEAIETTGGKETAEMFWRAKVLPQNTKCVHDGKDVSKYRAILTCRGSPYGQLDVTKPQICLECITVKVDIIKHVKHTAFIPTLDKSRGLQHSRRCMVCINPNLGLYKCAECPLRLCDGCQTMLSLFCKGYLDLLLYQMEKAHIRNDAFLLRSDGAGF